jgi:hypothetical protein
VHGSTLFCHIDSVHEITGALPAGEQKSMYRRALGMGLSYLDLKRTDAEPVSAAPKPDSRKLHRKQNPF